MHARRHASLRRARCLPPGVRSLTSWVAGPASESRRGAAVPTYDLAGAPKLEASLPWRQLQDDARRLGALAPAPAGALLAAADNLGRVLLVDGATMVVLRMWKVGRERGCVNRRRASAACTAHTRIGWAAVCRLCDVGTHARCARRPACRPPRSYAPCTGLPRRAVRLGAAARGPPLGALRPASGALRPQARADRGLGAARGRARRRVARGLRVPAAARRRAVRRVAERAHGAVAGGRAAQHAGAQARRQGARRDLGHPRPRLEVRRWLLGPANAAGRVRIAGARAAALARPRRPPLLRAPGARAAHDRSPPLLCGQ